MAAAAVAAEKRKVVLVAGKPSHPPRMHEFNAGVQLMAKCLNEGSEVEAHYVLNAWPTDESVFDENIATFEDDAGAYNQKDAEGFIKLNSLRLRIAALKGRSPLKK